MNSAVFTLLTAARISRYGVADVVVTVVVLHVALVALTREAGNADRCWESAVNMLVREGETGDRKTVAVAATDAKCCERKV